MLIVFFFFKQKTAYEMRISDWSSDVCSSDLLASGDARIILEPDRMRSAAPGERHRRLMLAGHHDLGFRGRRPLHVLVLFEMEKVGSENAEDRLRRGVGREAAPQHEDVERIRSEEHTSELQSLMRISYAVFCL